MSLKKFLFASIILISDATGFHPSTDFDVDGFVPSHNYERKGDLGRLSTSARSFLDDRTLAKREGYRYFGTGSKSSNSFTPTTIHKTTSTSDSHNYFVTSKSSKDMDAAGSNGNEMTSGHGGGSYLTIYEPAPSSMMGHNGMEEHYGDMASESGHGGGYGGGHGGGGGKGCNSALGLLGVLGLAAYLQNVLRNMNATGRRRRRDVDFDDPFDPEVRYEHVRNGMAMLEGYMLPKDEPSEKMDNFNRTTHDKVMSDVFPLLSAVAHAKDGLIPIHCTHSSVCQANQILVQDLGPSGHSIGIRISSAISKLLSTKTKDERAEQIRMISKAGKMGRNGRNCRKVFPTCNRLNKLPTYTIPSHLYLENNRS